MSLKADCKAKAGSTWRGECGRAPVGSSCMVCTLQSIENFIRQSDREKLAYAKSPLSLLTLLELFGIFKKFLLTLGVLVCSEWVCFNKT